MTQVLQEVVTLLTSGISHMATGIGTGLGNLVTSIFLTTGTDGAITGLSTFGGIAIVFMGVSLAIGLSRFVVNWVTNLGK